MAQGRLRAGIQPGDGVVARHGDVFVVVARGGEAFTDALLRMVATSYADPAAVLWRIVGLVAAHQPDVPAFAVAIGEEDARRVLVHGSARAVVGAVEISAVELQTWTERVVPLEATVALTITAGPVVATPRSHVDGGVLAGAGLVLESEVAERAAAATPLPVHRAPVLPPRPPTSDDVATAMRNPALETVQLADTIAALLADDGSRVPLDRDYVFGRNPHRDPAVVSGSASPVTIDDAEHLISRVHASVAVTAAAVTVRDRGSANGTFVAAPGDAAWTRIGTDPVPLAVGHSMRLGLRVYTHVPAEEPRGFTALP